MEENLIKRIWKDPVLSKVIAFFIIAALSSIGLSLIKLIGINTENEDIIRFQDIVIEFLQLNYKNILIIILITILMFFLYYYLKEKYFNKNIKLNKIKKIDKKWLINKLINEPRRYMFLLWYSIHGQTSCDINLKISSEEERKVNSSKTFKELIEKKIIFLYQSQWSFDITINENAYNIIDKYIKEKYINNDDEGDFMNYIKVTPFETLLKVHIFSSDYIKMR